jgi:hypothetical protein
MKQEQEPWTSTSPLVTVIVAPSGRRRSRASLFAARPDANQPVKLKGTVVKMD